MNTQNELAYEIFNTIRVILDNPNSQSLEWKFLAIYSKEAPLWKDAASILQTAFPSRVVTAEDVQSILSEVGIGVSLSSQHIADRLNALRPPVEAKQGSPKDVRKTMEGGAPGGTDAVLHPMYGPCPDCGWQGGRYDHRTACVSHHRYGQDKGILCNFVTGDLCQSTSTVLAPSVQEGTEPPKHQPPTAMVGPDERAIEQAVREACGIRLNEATCIVVAAKLKAKSARAVAREAFIERVRPWLLQCFGAEVANDKQERNFRFLEESMELAQSCGASKEDCLKRGNCETRGCVHWIE